MAARQRESRVRAHDLGDEPHDVAVADARSLPPRAYTAPVPRIPEQHADAFARFARGPALVRAAIDGADPAAFNRRPSGGDWSMRDIVVHLADGELVLAVRLRMALAGGEPLLPAWDGELWKRRLLYVFRDAEAALECFRLARHGSAELLRECAPDAWERRARHPGLGAITVGGLVARGADHAGEHAAQLRALRDGDG